MGTQTHTVCKTLRKHSFVFPPQKEQNMKLPSDSTQGRHVVHTTQLLPQASHRTFPRRQRKGGVCSARLAPKLQRRPAQRVCKSNTSKVQSSTPHTLLDGRAESTRAATLSRARPHSPSRVPPPSFRNIADDGKRTRAQNS